MLAEGPGARCLGLAADSGRAWGLQREFFPRQGPLGGSGRSLAVDLGVLPPEKHVLLSAKGRIGQSRCGCSRHSLGVDHCRLRLSINALLRRRCGLRRRPFRRFLLPRRRSVGSSPPEDLENLPFRLCIPREAGKGLGISVW